MLKLFSPRICVRFFVSVAKSVKKENPRGQAIITCKRKELDFYENDAIRNVKFGQLTLASSGWRHRKAKGDFFVLHPTEDKASGIAKDRPVEDLKKMFDDQLVENLKNELNVTDLSEIQEKGIPTIINMNHVLIAAETGCGKTLTYLLPIVQQILHKQRHMKPREMNTPLAIIITPGRELATQIANVAEKLTAGLNIKVKSVLGGHTKQMMMHPEFADVDILVATMGALSKLVTTGIYRVNKVRHVVLDEADTLLDDSFSGKLCHFLKKFPFHRNHLLDLSDDIVGTQLILASATMPTNVSTQLEDVVDTDTMHEVVSPNLHQLLPHVMQKFIRMNKSERPTHLLALVKSEIIKRRPVIIFGNKSPTSDFISLFLNDRGVRCTNLNGDMLTEVRKGKFDSFQNGEVDILSTTDVGSRGLDTTRARHVINFDFPLHAADYIHRCGRIGRIGSDESCRVTNFISSQREIELVQKIEHCARTRQVLPGVNGNITSIIKRNIINSLNQDGVEVI